MVGRCTRRGPDELEQLFLEAVWLWVIENYLLVLVRYYLRTERVARVIDAVKY